MFARSILTVERCVGLPALARSPHSVSCTARCRPPVSGALPSHGLTPQYYRRSGLSFRVRNGSGRTPPAMAADRWAAPAGAGPSPACPQGRTARPRSSRRPRRGERLGAATGAPAGAGAGRKPVRARAISTARLSASPRVHLPPIDPVFYRSPYRRETPSLERLPA